MSSIERIHSYPEFPNDAIKAFTNIIENYDFVIESKSITHILFSNNTIQICFDMDRYDLRGILIQKNVKPRRKFGITQVISHLNPNFQKSEDLKSFEHHKWGENAFETLNWYAKMTEKYLKSVLDGNFEWSEYLFRVVNSDRIKLIDFIYEHFDNQNEILKLYENEDGNWEPKLYKYLMENKIEI